MPFTLGHEYDRSGTGTGFCIRIEYDLAADDKPRSSITVRLTVYSPGLRKVWLTELTFVISPSKSEMFHDVESNDVSPSGSNERLENV